MDLLTHLKTLYPDCSKTTLRSWLEHGRIKVGGKVVKRGDIEILPGQEVDVGKKAQPIKNNVKILFEDKHLIVIEKPEGLLSVATDFNLADNAHTILKDRVHPKRVFPVHRLDRETSGVMVFAYSEEAKEGLKDQFFHHSIEREYHGLVEGHLEPKEGTWKSFLKEDENYYVSENSTDGQLAITHYKVLKRTAKLSLVQFTLETGRKNQIRVHCQAAGAPIFGDKKYGGQISGAPRLCLHAKRLSFVHPVTEMKKTFLSDYNLNFS